MSMDKCLLFESLLPDVAAEVAAAADGDAAYRAVVNFLAERVPHFHWTGIYLLEGDTLVLHNYVGAMTEHTRIPVGRGVCGTAVAEASNIIVEDVTQRENYLACSLATRSEIVVLIRDGESILGQIDIDSDEPGAFDAQDERFLESVAEMLALKVSECA